VRNQLKFWRVRNLSAVKAYLDSQKKKKSHVEKGKKLSVNPSWTKKGGKEEYESYIL
jgi:hypothetical protein